MPDRHSEALSARLNSKKSSTYGNGVEHSIIERKARGKAPAGSPAGPGAAAPAIRHVRIEEDSAGQRLDNFLVKLLKGVPKTHVYRVIRSGEVRVNKGRAGADTRLALGDDVRVPPVRVSAPADDSRAAGAAARVSGRLRGRLAARARQAGRRRGAWRQRRQLRRHRAVAARPPGGALPRARAPARQGDVRAAAAREEALGAAGAAGPAARTRCRALDGEDVRRAGGGSLARQPEGDRRAAAQVPRLGRRAPRPHGRRRARRRPALDHAGPRRAALRRLDPARRDPEDRTHPPDPRPPGRCRPRRSPATTSTATAR